MNANDWKNCCRLPPLLRFSTQLICALIVLFVSVVLICDHCGLDRTGTRLIRAGFAADRDLDTAQTAIEQGDAASLRQVLGKADFEVDACDGQGMRPLSRAVRNNWVEGCRLLLRRGACASGVDENGMTPLMWAVYASNGRTGCELIDLLIRDGVEVDERGREGLTACICAAHFGNVDGLGRLIAAGADVDVAMLNGFTPLHFAAMNDDVEKVQLLLGAGADASATDDKGETALQVARANESPGATRLLEAELPPPE